MVGHTQSAQAVSTVLHLCTGKVCSNCPNLMYLVSCFGQDVLRCTSLKLCLYVAFIGIKSVSKILDILYRRAIVSCDRKEFLDVFGSAVDRR